MTAPEVAGDQGSCEQVRFRSPQGRRLHVYMKTMRRSELNRETFTRVGPNAQPMPKWREPSPSPQDPRQRPSTASASRLSEEATDRSMPSPAPLMTPASDQKLLPREAFPPFHLRQKRSHLAESSTSQVVTKNHREFQLLPFRFFILVSFLLFLLFFPFFPFYPFFLFARSSVF